MTVSERRKKILDYITYRRKVTYKEIAEEFSVSLNTATRDVMFISQYIPVYTKQGKGGGVYMMPKYRASKYYLSAKEEILLCELLERVSDDEKKILKGILFRFARDTLPNV